MQSIGWFGTLVVGATVWCLFWWIVGLIWLLYTTRDKSYQGISAGILFAFSPITMPFSPFFLLLKWLEWAGEYRRADPGRAIRNNRVASQVLNELEGLGFHVTLKEAATRTKSCTVLEVRLRPDQLDSFNDFLRKVYEESGLLISLSGGSAETPLMKLHELDRPAILRSMRGKQINIQLTVDCDKKAPSKRRGSLPPKTRHLYGGGTLAS